MPLRNYGLFLDQLAQQNIPFTMVELARAEEGFVVPEPSPDYPNHKVVRILNPNAAILWQPNRLYNHIINTYLPAQCDKVAWVDCDILFKIKIGSRTWKRNLMRLI